jgi:hypothetical protein
MRAALTAIKAARESFIVDKQLNNTVVVLILELISPNDVTILSQSDAGTFSVHWMML